MRAEFVSHFFAEKDRRHRGAALLNGGEGIGIGLICLCGSDILVRASACITASTRSLFQGIRRSLFYAIEQIADSALISRNDPF